jgi:hypothetical protein
MRRPFVTTEVWSPWNLDSRATSRHHWEDIITTMASAVTNNIFPMVTRCSSRI